MWFVALGVAAAYGYVFCGGDSGPLIHLHPTMRRILSSVRRRLGGQLDAAADASRQARPVRRSVPPVNDYDELIARASAAAGSGDDDSKAVLHRAPVVGDDDSKAGLQRAPRLRRPQRRAGCRDRDDDADDDDDEEDGDVDGDDDDDDDELDMGPLEEAVHSRFRARDDDSAAMEANYTDDSDTESALGGSESDGDAQGDGGDPGLRGVEHARRDEAKAPGVIGSWELQDQALFASQLQLLYEDEVLAKEQLPRAKDALSEVRASLVRALFAADLPADADETMCAEFQLSESDTNSPQLLQRVMGLFFDHQLIGALTRIAEQTRVLNFRKDAAIGTADVEVFLYVLLILALHRGSESDVRAIVANASPGFQRLLDVMPPARCRLVAECLSMNSAQAQSPKHDRPSIEDATPGLNDFLDMYVSSLLLCLSAL